MNKFAKALGISVLAVSVLAGCSESSVEKVEGEGIQEEEDVQEEKDNTNENEEEKKETFTVGDTVKFDDLNITLEKTRVVPGDEFAQPENAEFIAVELDVENTSEEAATISTMMNMSLMSDEGYEQDQTIMVDGKGNLDSEIGPGRSVKGEIVFDTEEADYYEFIFDDPFTSGQAIWKIDSDQIEQ